VDTKERFWEAADLIVKAWTSHDGPFNWEGRHYHHRQVNVWPRVYQDPHPPLWVPTQSVSTAVEVAERPGYTLATILNGWQGAKKIFDAFRVRSLECGYGDPHPEQLGYLGLLFVGETDEEGYAGARKLQWYLQHNKVAPQFINVPGHVDVRTRTILLKQLASGKTLVSPVEHLAWAPIEQLTEEGFFFAGSPDSVLEQVTRFYERVGGFGNLLAMVHSGTMGEELVTSSMRLYAEEVLPRVRRSVDQRGSRVPAVASGVPVTGAEYDPEQLRLP
jgi:alkanesulfonate monooxygenase SsuD/methylene tetrahydromethanopterin reductase-like flavin-dependent oxidoreductase (luciferase family)